MIEEWRPIPGWVGYYEVSNIGQVRGVARLVNGGNNPGQRVPSRVLLQRLQVHGYPVVSLRRGRPTHVTERVHRLVASAFIPNSEIKPSVNHLDNDPKNNSATNLEWCTQAENLEHMTRQGRRKNGQKGKRSPKRALSDAEAAAIRERYKVGGVSLADIAIAFQTNKRTVGRIILGQSYVCE